MTQLSIDPRGVSLRSILAEQIQGSLSHDIRATSCTNEWRQLRPGDVYVAIDGADDDGHDYAEDAANRGAAALVCERPLPVFNVPQIVVADSRVAYGTLCQALVGNPSRELKVIAVAGTHGKSTVSRLLSVILRTAGISVGTLDSFGYWNGEEARLASGGSLSAPQLASTLAEMSAAGNTHAIVELSARELSQQVLAGVELDAICLTNVLGKNLEWHGSLANYRQATRRVFEHAHPDAVAILNADDPTCVEFLSTLDRPALTYGMRVPAEISATIVEQNVNEQVFMLSAGDDLVGLRTAIVGDHHVHNCLAAATIALAYGIELPVIARGLESVESLPGRMERVACGQDFSVLIDKADSPEAMRACLRTARKAATGRVICVFGTDGDCERRSLPAIGRVIGAMADAAVLTTSVGGDDSHRACLELRSGFVDPHKARVILDRGEAIRTALGDAEPGDTIVIAGMGDRNHTPPDEDGAALNDFEIAREFLYACYGRPQLRLAA